jgi:hypothetical protein
MKILRFLKTLFLIYRAKKELKANKEIMKITKQWVKEFN